MNSHHQLSRRELISTSIFLGLATALPLSANPRWREAAPLPIRVQEIYPCLHEGDIWVAGGLSPDTPDSQINITDQVVRYNINDNTWRPGPTLPEPRHHGFLVSTDNRLLLFGGFIAANGGRWSATRDVLLLEDGEWKKIAETPSAQMETVTAVSDGNVHLAGGRAPGGTSNANWGDQSDVVTHQVFDTRTLETTMSAPLPMARNSAASFVIGNQWHIVGGRTVGGGNADRHDIFDLEEQRWHSGPPLPQAQGGLAAASIGLDGYVFGGEFFSSDGGGVYSEVWHYNSETERWQNAGVMPVPRHGLGALTVDDSIYVIAGATSAGGVGTSNRISIFTP